MTKIPTIHAGGTDPQTLLDRYGEVTHGIASLATKIREAAPRAIDYPDHATFQHARNDHHAMLATLEKIRIHYDEIATGIHFQLRAPRVK